MTMRCRDGLSGDQKCWCSEVFLSTPKPCAPKWTSKINKHPVGGKSAPAFWTFFFFFLCRFRHKRNDWFIPQNTLKIPREFEVFFLTMTCNFQGISWKGARCFFHLTSPCAPSRRDQWARKGFCFWSYTLMLRINFGLTWPLVLVERLHGMADFDSRQQGETQPSR